MIGLSASIYMVSYNNATFDHHVYVRDRTGIQEITEIMTDMEKAELISDLIFEIYDFTKQQSIRKDIIDLQRSRFAISYGEHTGNYRIYMRGGGEYHDITKTITKRETEELINDLIYCVHIMATYCEVI